MDQHKVVLDDAKSEYEKLKKAVDEMRASEVMSYSAFLCIIVLILLVVYTTLHNVILFGRWTLSTSYRI